MKKIVTVPVIEVEGEGLTALLGKRVVIYCLNYIYSGLLAGVNTTCVLLEDAGIVYDTGSHDNAGFADYQKVSHPLYIQVGAIESFSETSKK